MIMPHSDITSPVVHIVGGGLAGSEAAFQVAQRGIRVVLHEMRPVRKTDAHHTENLAELVCSNSFRSDDAEANAVGVLHAEMRIMDSVIMSAADEHKVPAGGALAVDRDGFSAGVQARLAAHPLIELAREEVTEIPEDWNNVIIATGPLTSPPLAQMAFGSKRSVAPGALECHPVGRSYVRSARTIYPDFPGARGPSG